MDIKRLANKFMPNFYLHKNEVYYPCSIDKYLSECSLWYDDKLYSEYVDGDILVKADVPDKSLLNLQTRYINFLCGSREKLLNDVPVYTRITEAEFNKNIIEIKYIIFFAYSGAYRVCCNDIGNHFADIEHLTIRIDKKTEKIIQVYFSAHGKKWGKWVDPEDLEFAPNGVFSVYIAKGSHAFYWKAGTYLRIFGLFNDHCCNDVLWIPDKIEIADSQPWLGYKGKMGYDSVDMMSNTEWWDTESGESCHWIKRFLFPYLLL